MKSITRLKVRFWAPLPSRISHFSEKNKSLISLVLNFLREKKPDQNDKFDLKEQLINNVYIFKENFKTTLRILSKFHKKIFENFWQNSSRWPMEQLFKH